MALFSKGKGTREPGGSEGVEEVQAKTTAPHAESGGRGQDCAPGGELNAYLGKGSSVSGKLAFSGAVRLDGRVEGEISAQQGLLIGESAVVNAQITGNAVIITGRVTGDITARKRVEIRAPGRLFGNVTTPSLIIEEGVVFEGHCSMGAGEVERDRKVARLPREEKASEKAAEPQSGAAR